MSRSRTRAGAALRTSDRRRRSLERRRWPAGWIVVPAVILVGAVTFVFANRSRGPGEGTAYVGGDLHSVVVAPGPEHAMFVGGHEAVSASRDGGRTWSAVPTLQGADAMAWAFLNEAIWVGGHPGLEVSTDGGRTFAPRNAGLPATDIHALGGTGSTLYAASPAAGFLRSSDAGATWKVRNPSVGHAFMGRLLVDPSDPDHVVAPDMEAGAVETSDGGRSWRVLADVPGAMWVSWDPRDTDRIVVSSFGIAAASADGGATWSRLSLPSDVSIVEIAADGSGTWYGAMLKPDGTVAITVSSDRGSSWDVVE
jgi:photosystem II stability/assembly factor-like uncharacterized protein